MSNKTQEMILLINQWKDAKFPWSLTIEDKKGHFNAFWTALMEWIEVKKRQDGDVDGDVDGGVDGKWRSVGLG